MRLLIVKTKWTVFAFTALLAFMLQTSLYGSLHNEAIALQETKKITGQVTDATTGEALPGVSIMVKGTQMGTEQKVTRKEAIRMYTRNGAYLTFEEEIKGSLETGKLADMIILDRDILTCPEDDIKDTKVLRTFLGGKTVYTA